MSMLPDQSHMMTSYNSLTRGLNELDFRGTQVPSKLILIGDDSFPLAMTSRGEILAAASLYGSGRIVVLSHESYLTTFPALVENALTWLRGDESENLYVGVHTSVRAVAENLSSSIFMVEVVGGFSADLAVGVYVTDAYSVDANASDLVAFLKAGGGVLMGGQSWYWTSMNPKLNTLHSFPGNKVSGVTGIYFSRDTASTEYLSMKPEIPSSWKAVGIGKDFSNDLEFLLSGIPELILESDVLASEVLVHGPLSFPICMNKDRQTFLAGAYYGRGRVIAVTHEGLLRQKPMASLWKNAILWLDEGRQGVIGVEPLLSDAFNLLSKFGLKCEKTAFRKDLSVYVCRMYSDDQAEEIQEFVAEGGGLLIGGHAWYWAQTHKGENPMTLFSGNKILNKMGLSVLQSTVATGSYKAPYQPLASKDSYHFCNLLNSFAAHVTHGKTLAEQQEACLQKLGGDCAAYLKMEGFGCFSYTQVLSVLTDVMRTSGMPQVSESSPVRSPRDHFLLHVGTALHRVCLDPDALLPILIKDNPSLPVVENQQIIISIHTGGEEEWVSTGLYLSPGMRTFITIPAEIINKGWKIQIGAHTDYLTVQEIKRARCVHVRIPVKEEVMEVYNLWGGLIYLVAPPNTQVAGAEVKVQRAVLAPYYKSGVSTVNEWSSLRAAPAPWAEFEFENIILTVPSDVVRDLERPDLLAARWDTIMKNVANLAAVPEKFQRKERFVTDVQISHGWMHAGYPIMAHLVSARDLVTADIQKCNDKWGPVHELGHNQQRGSWEFPPNTTESTCNLWSMYVLEKGFGIHKAEAHPALMVTERRARTKQYVKEGRKLSEWTLWVALETYIQLQEKFGWDAFKKVFASYHNITNVPNDNDGKMNMYAETFSKVVQQNLAGFFKSWGWPIQDATEKKLSNLPPWSDHPMVDLN